MFAIISSNHLRRMLARSLAIFARQAGSAAAAASIARRVSAAPIFGIVPITAPFAGLVTLIVGLRIRIQPLAVDVALLAEEVGVFELWGRILRRWVRSWGSLRVVNVVTT